MGTVLPPSENDDIQGLGKLRDLKPSVLVPNPRFWAGGATFGGPKKQNYRKSGVHG